MLPDRVLNPGPLTYESGALPIALRGPAEVIREYQMGVDTDMVDQIRVNILGVDIMGSRC